MVLPYIDLNPSWVYMCSPSWTPLPLSSPSNPSGSSQCTSPEHPVSCIKLGLRIRFTYDNLHVSMPFSHIIPHSPSPTESKRLFCTSVSLLLSHIRGYRYRLSKFHIYALVYCIKKKYLQRLSNSSGTAKLPLAENHWLYMFVIMQRLLDWIKEQDLIICCLYDTCRLIRRQKEMWQCLHAC